MDFLLIAFFVLAVKLPVLYCCWYIYRAIHDVPEPEIRGEGGDFVRAEFEQGPRRRGPHPNGPAGSAARRKDKGHHEERKPARRTTPSAAGE